MDQDRPMAAMYDHCVLVYKKMADESTPETIEEGGVRKATGYVVWTGYTTGLFQELGLATPYYTSAMNALRAMGCVEQLKRGGGAAKSQWRLVREPTEEAYHAIKDRKRPRQGSVAGLEQQIRDLTQRIERLEETAHEHV